MSNEALTYLHAQGATAGEAKRAAANLAKAGEAESTVNPLFANGAAAKAPGSSTDESAAAPGDDDPAANFNKLLLCVGVARRDSRRVRALPIHAS